MIHEEQRDGFDLTWIVVGAAVLLLGAGGLIFWRAACQRRFAEAMAVEQARADEARLRVEADRRRAEEQARQESGRK